ncbi:MAG: hypothetical protein AB8H80_18280 [Planctomycetota bacterium]
MRTIPILLASALATFTLSAQEPGQRQERGQQSAPPKPAAVGEAVPNASFPQFFNDDGRQQLSDFYGGPLLIEKWGTR